MIEKESFFSKTFLFFATSLGGKKTDLYFSQKGIRGNEKI